MERLMASIFMDWEINSVLSSVHIGFGGLSALPTKAPPWPTSSITSCPPPPMVVTGVAQQHLCLRKKWCGIWFSICRVWFRAEVISFLFVKNLMLHIIIGGHKSTLLCHIQTEFILFKYYYINYFLNTLHDPLSLSFPIYSSQAKIMVLKIGSDQSV